MRIIAVGVAGLGLLGCLTMSSKCLFSIASTNQYLPSLLELSNSNSIISAKSSIDAARISLASAESRLADGIFWIAAAMFCSYACCLLLARRH